MALRFLIVLALCGLASGCSGHDSFTALPTAAPVLASSNVTQTFNPFQTVNETVSSPAPAAIDLLWVIDNSGSMAANQAKLLAGIQGFVQTYLAPLGNGGQATARDVRLAVITTDTWCAGNPGCVYYDHCNAQSQAQFPLRYGYPSDYSLLIPGIHDGVLPTVASASLGDAKPVGWVDPASGVATCDQTTVRPRSGQPILSAKTIQSPSDLTQFVADFTLNANVGVFGSGSNRGFQSISQLLSDNELQPACQGANQGPSCFFRPNAARGLLLISDDCDHTGAPDPNASTSSWGCAGFPAVNTMKTTLDGFFRGLDGSGPTGDPRYFVLAIAGQLTQEYLHLAWDVGADPSNSLGPWSSSEDIDDPSYTQLLNGIGGSIQSTTPVQTVLSVFTLTTPVPDPSSLTVFVEAPGGALTPVDSSAYQLITLPNGTQQLQMNAATLASLVSPGDQLVVSFPGP